jgi:hypothetical protein
MSAVHEVIESEIERVERWRVEELMRAGYDPVGCVNPVRLEIASFSGLADGGTARTHLRRISKERTSARARPPDG